MRARRGEALTGIMQITCHTRPSLSRQLSFIFIQFFLSRNIEEESSPQAKEGILKTKKKKYFFCIVCQIVSGTTWSVSARTTDGPSLLQRTTSRKPVKRIRLVFCYMTLVVVVVVMMMGFYFVDPAVLALDTLACVSCSSSCLSVR